MSSVDLLTQYLDRQAEDTATVTNDGYTLRIVAGRPGSICFTLEQEVASDERVVVAEGFSLDDRIDYVQRSIAPAEVERIIAKLIGTRLPANVTPIPATISRQSSSARASHLAAGA